MNQLFKNSKSKKLCLVVAILIMMSCVICGCVKGINEIGVKNNQLDGEYLLQEFSFDTTKSQAKNIAIAKQAMKKDKATISERVDDVDSSKFYKDNNLIRLDTNAKRYPAYTRLRELLTFLHLYEVGDGGSPCDVWRTISYEDQSKSADNTSEKISFDYQYHIGRSYSEVNTKKLVDDVQYVFGKLEDPESFRKFIEDNIVEMEAFKFDHENPEEFSRSEIFKTASGVDVVVSFSVRFGVIDAKSPNINIFGEYSIEL